MIAITTNNSMSVKARDRDGQRRTDDACMAHLEWEWVASHFGKNAASENEESSVRKTVGS
jgi:hypothetical protein